MYFPGILHANLSIQNKVLFHYNDVRVCRVYRIDGFFEILKFHECLIFSLFVILFFMSGPDPLYGSRGLIPMLGMHAAI